MTTYDWGSFKLRIPVNTDPETLYRLWMTQEGLESWFLRKADFSKPNGNKIAGHVLVETGDRYEWLWHGHDDDTMERGAILHCNGTSKLQFSFGKAGNVMVSFKEEQNEMMVELFQDQIPTDEKGKEYYHLGCSKGWVFYLANLKSVAEGGLDLRNKNGELKDVVSS